MSASKFLGYMSPIPVEPDGTIFIHHYPHRTPRVEPAGLTDGLIPWAAQETSARPWDEKRL